MKTFSKFLIARAQEASSWRGVFLILTSAGLVLKPELQEGIVALGLAAAGLVGLIVPDATPDAQ